MNSKSPRSIDENWLFFRDNFLKVINHYVLAKIISKRTHLPWVNTSLKRLIRKKQRVYNRAKFYSRESDWFEYKNLQKQVSQTLKQQHREYLNILSSNDKKPLWRFIKAKKQDNVNISSLKTPDGQIITDPASKANVLNQYFKTVFTVEDGKNQPHKGQSLYPAIANFEITTQGVYNILNTCNPYKSPGLDGIHPHALRETATEVSPMLTHIYQQSLSTVVLPTQWKHAYVTPIFKKGAKTDPTNYRLVSLTSVVCKSMEHILASQIMQHLSIHNILSDIVSLALD